MSNKRLVLVGLDGVPYGLIKDLSDRGIIPNIREIIEKGAFKQMCSTIPEVSSVAWSSIITGANPAEHGIFGFTSISGQNYQLGFPNFTDLKKEPFWNNSSGPCIIINVPGTYPVREMKGVHISGFVSIEMEKSVYPASLIPEFKKLDYRLDVNSEIAHKSLDMFMRDLQETLEARINAYRWLWKYTDWQVFMLVFTGTDRLFHFLWSAYEDQDHKYHEQFLEHFKQIDRVIGEIASDLSSGETMLVFSDHGFERLDQDIFINRILEENGFLHTYNSKNLSAMDKATKAFSLDPARIYVHTEDRYCRGSVKTEEKENVIKELEDMFYSLEVEGKKVVKKVLRKEEVYRGSYMDSAPDLVLLSHKGFNLRSSLASNKTFSSSFFTGKHTYDNAFILSNQDVLPEKEGFSVIDAGKLIGGLV